MTYRVVIPRPVQKEMDALQPEVRERILARLQTLTENPRPPSVVKLKGTQNEYRIRIGDYRVRYEIHDDESVVLLLHCGHRKDVYRS